MANNLLESAKEILKSLKEDPAQAESLSKALMVKDDKPHPGGSPEARAHDVKEFDKPLKPEMAAVPAPSDKSKLLSHLRSLGSPDKLRSPENVKAAVHEKWEPRHYKMEKAGVGASQAPAPATVPPPQAPAAKKPAIKKKPEPLYHAEKESMDKADILDFKTGKKLASHKELNPKDSAPAPKSPSPAPQSPQKKAVSMAKPVAKADIHDFSTGKKLATHAEVNSKPDEKRVANRRSSLSTPTGRREEDYKPAPKSRLSPSRVKQEAAKASVGHSRRSIDKVHQSRPSVKAAIKQTQKPTGTEKSEMVKSALMEKWEPKFYKKD